MKIHIRPERTNEQGKVYEINRRAFNRAGEADLVDALRKTKRFNPGLLLVAEHYEELLGCILLYPVDIVEGSNITPALALAPVAVLPQHQRKGIGGKLVKVSLGKAKKLGFKSVIVLGNAAYYTRFGFKPASLWGIKPSFEVPEKNFMAIELEPEALRSAAGVVYYPKEYASVSGK